jgi:hypothetical protein
MGGVFVHGASSLPANSFSPVRPPSKVQSMQPWGSTAAPTATPAAGWFADPHNPSVLRWWDGTAWTEHRAPGWQAPQAAPGLDHELDWLLPVNRDGFAIAAGYLGLFSLIPNPITSVAAIICGLAALSSIKRTGKLGRGRAWVGLIIGGLSLGVFLLAVIGANASSN